jgi:hypothetical protein
VRPSVVATTDIGYALPWHWSALRRMRHRTAVNTLIAPAVPERAAVSRAPMIKQPSNHRSPEDRSSAISRWSRSWLRGSRRLLCRQEVLCRFSDGGGDEPYTRAGGRRLKSAKVRNRGKWGHRRCRGLYGDLAAASGWARLVRAPAQLLCLAGWVWVTGRTSAAGVAGQGWRCHCGPILSIRSKRGLCWPWASQNGERDWAGGSVVTAS